MPNPVKTRGKTPKKTPGASGKATPRKKEYLDVIFYVPNLIGYARIVLTGLFMYYAFSDWQTAIVCYIASFSLDFFDGYFARLLNQCSKLGQVLDMVTDRCSTAVLLLVLAMKENTNANIYCGLLALDFASHWFHMKSAGSGHHKSLNDSRGMIVRGYYHFYYFFGYCCVAAEFTYIFKYIALNNEEAFASLPGGDIMSVNNLLYYTVLPGCIVKNIVNVAQLWDAMCFIAQTDADEYNAAKK